MGTSFQPPHRGDPLGVHFPWGISVLTWVFESGQKGGDIKGFGDAAFFAAVQMLTVSSQIKNPLTVAGRIVDVGLEVWAAPVNL
jgi:hypothetical protein